ncbi:hypothetical protein G6F68_021303 [Rhizopus microsporus]|nr:hypothetical protein G6F68_021303 [Rhizopus microsporus]
MAGMVSQFVVPPLVALESLAPLMLSLTLVPLSWFSPMMLLHLLLKPMAPVITTMVHFQLAVTPLALNP